jgi:DNA primase
MNFNAIKFLNDYNIPYKQEGKNISKGWVGISCPFCYDTSTHGGFNLEKGNYSCWRCGKHQIEEIIKILTRCKPHHAFEIVKAYTGASLIKQPPKTALHKPTGALKLIGQTPLTNTHQNYLAKRGFNPSYLSKKYYLRGTGPIGKFKHRIIIPIILNGEIISYQTRDITGIAELRYKPCPKEEEVIPYKHTLYNIDSCYDKAIILEGVTDVWRMGNGAVATFGIMYTQEQIRLLIDNGIKEVFIVFDPEPQAQKQANKLASDLIGFGITTEVVQLNDWKDPAEMSNQKALELKRELFSIM